MIDSRTEIKEAMMQSILKDIYDALDHQDIKPRDAISILGFVIVMVGMSYGIPLKMITGLITQQYEKAFELLKKPDQNRYDN